MMKSMSAGSTPAICIARRAAIVDIEEVVSSGAETCRDSMPVRVRIHSSVVSTSFSRSALVTIFSGR